MKPDATYQECLPSCELHSRSLAVGHTGASDLEIVHTCVTQSPECAMQSRDCANSQIARNIYTSKIRIHVNITQATESCLEELLGNPWEETT